MSNTLFSLSGKKYLVTGASSGIGRSIAIMLAEQGADVIITARNEERLRETLTLMKGSNHSFISADLSEEESLKTITSNFESLDGVVHAAGIMNTLPYKFITRKALGEIMDVNFIAPSLLTQTMLKAKKIKSGGSIVFISSIGGNVIGSKGNAMYSATKGAINASAKVLALELAGQKIRVNNVAPGMVKTEMWATSSSFSQEQLDEDEKKYPLGYGNPEDVAGAVVFLLSDASRWVTGSTLVLDGGFTIQ